MLSVSCNLNLRQFLEIEKIQEYDTPPMPQEDREIQEETARSTILVDARYQVKLPWKKTTPEIPQSYDMALRRLESTERKLKKFPLLKKCYLEAIQAYINEGCLETRKGADGHWLVFITSSPDLGL